MRFVSVDMSTQVIDRPAAKSRAVPGKYLTFMLGREYYGVGVLKIREIIRLVDITPVPQMPDYIKGVINLRGKIIPVVDLRLKFGLASTETTERTCIVVVQVVTNSGGATQMGLVVDAVEEVVNLGAADIEATPDFGARLHTGYILGMAKIKNNVKTLLDIDEVLTADVLRTI